MPNVIQLRQVETALVREYEDLLDLDDLAAAPNQQRGKVLRTRALAAEAVRHAAGVPRREAADAVTDGSGDNGIDAIYVDPAGPRVILVQAKWHSTGSGTIGVGDAHAFIQGFKDLTDEAYDRFNDKVRAHRGEVGAALNEPNLLIEMIIVSTGGAVLAPEVSRLLDDVRAQFNQDAEMLKVSVWGLEYLRTRLAQETAGGRINLRNVQVENYGSLSEPYQAYYGVVDGRLLKSWYEEHGDNLFSQNIRKALGSTTVNTSLQDTVANSPENFWYYNNGVTVLCDKIVRKARGATTRNLGEFDLEGASVVNGAQTVASIAGSLAPDADEDVTPKVWIRAISLEGCPPDFATLVTRATNTQNSVESRDFVSLDDEQLRLRTDFRLSLSKTYSIKRGEAEPNPSDGCTVIEAATALACMQPDVALAVIAKSAPGRLWDMQGRYYRQLFSGSTSAYTVWRAVQTMRWVDEALDEVSGLLGDGRPRAVNAQGRRVVLWAVFRAIDRVRMSDPSTEWEDERESISALAKRIHDAVFQEVERSFPTNYVTSLFKNAGRCRELVSALP